MPESEMAKAKSLISKVCTSAKRSMARATGIPTTKQGGKRKFQPKLPGGNLVKK